MFDSSTYNDTSLYSIQSIYFAYYEMPDSFKTKFYGNMFLKGTQQNLVFGFSDSPTTVSTRILSNGTLSQNVLYDFTNAEKVYLIIGNSQQVNIARDIPLIFNNYEIMISKDTATSYEPYGTNWYIEKNIGKVVLNGSETITAGITSITGKYRYHIPVADIKPTSSATEMPSILCDRYVAEVMGGAGIWNGHEGISVENGATKHNIVIFDNTYNAQDTTAYKTWLSSNNITVYYALATPTYTVITNENLIQQLNNIQDMQLIENLCYVDWVGEEKPTMYLQYGTTDILHAYIITENNKRIRTDWGI